MLDRSPGALVIFLRVQKRRIQAARGLLGIDLHEGEVLMFLLDTHGGGHHSS